MSHPPVDATGSDGSIERVRRTDNCGWRLADPQAPDHAGANSNLTTNTYDGFDRLRQVSFPSTTRGAGASDPTDYEAYAYDANGNRLTLRRRDASVINCT
jgi:hypothetical protein